MVVDVIVQLVEIKNVQVRECIEEGKEFSRDL